MTDKKKVFGGLFWRFAERSGAQIVQFIVSIVLARILAPEAYGTITLVLVFSQILQVFVDSGLGNALIQKKGADDLDFSTVFYFNVIWCLILYLIMFLTAPLISNFYHDSSLTAIVRVLCLTVIISGLKNIQQAYVTKNMMFKKFFFATIGGTITSAIIGIGMAKAGYGVWALVAQKITNLFIDTFVLWVTVDWRPKRMFSFERLKGLLSYGWKLLISAVLDTIFNNLRNLIIGKLYSTKDLAYYNKGDQFPNLIILNINTSIDSVLLPTMSNEQDNLQRIKTMTRRAIKTSTYVIAPLMMGLAFCGETVVRLILTAKWVSCVPYMQIFCVSYMFYPIHTANLNAIKALGRSDLFLKLEIIKKIMGLILLISTMWFGVEIMAYSLLASSILSQIINSWPNKKLLGYSYFEQLRDIFPSIILAVIMGVGVSFVKMQGFSDIFTLLLQVVLGIVIYIGCSVILKIDSFFYLLNILKGFIKKE